MLNIKLIDRNMDISKLKIRQMGWDTVINGKPYFVVRIVGYVHAIGGKYNNNDLWAYPRDEKPNCENLVQFEGEPVYWGINYAPYNYARCRHDEFEATTIGNVFITRNGEKFCDVRGGIERAKCMINDFNEHPINLNEIDFDKKVIGRKVWWRSEPAVVSNYISKQACVILEPDGIKQFTTPAEFADEGCNYYCDGDVKADILDKHIWWFRE
jgi:hypothetical protein